MQVNFLFILFYISILFCLLRIIGDYNKACENFNNSLEIKKKHWGRYSLKVAEEIILFFQSVMQKTSGSEKL